MVNYLAIPTDNWQLVLRRGRLHYRYTATGEPMAGLEACSAVIDTAGRLHIVVTLMNKRLIYACWQGRRWESRELPVIGPVLAFVMDSTDQPHLLLQKCDYQEIIHLYLTGNRWQQLVLPFNITTPPLLFKPLANGRLFLCSQDKPEDEDHLFITSFDPVKGWHIPCPVNGLKIGYKNFIYYLGEYLFHLAWYRQENGYLVKLNYIDPERVATRSLELGLIGELPDDQPVLLAKDKTLLFLWTSSSRLAFCFSQNGGFTWSAPQSAYFFFPARIKIVEGPDGPSSTQVAFTKISGLQPDWPLVVNVEPLLSLCRAVLAGPGTGEPSWQQ